MFSCRRDDVTEAEAFLVTKSHLPHASQGEWVDVSFLKDEIPVSNLKVEEAQNWKKG
jgi:hypothetical protein